MGYAGIDVLLLSKDCLVIVEAKLTQTPNAELQIRELYFPLVKLIYPQRRVQSLCVFKNMRDDVSTIDNLQQVLDSAVEGTFHWHFLGTGN